MDILANMVTTTQLETYGQTAYGSIQFNQDQWCYIVNQILGTPCPAYDIGNPPTVKTSAQVFLDGLRNYELGVNATNQGPGGSGAPPAVVLPPTAGAVAVATGTSATGQAPVGMGLLGPTNCQFCIWLRSNPWALVIAAAAIYFGFFYKK